MKSRAIQVLAAAAVAVPAFVTSARGQSCAADLNGDGQVNATDLATLLAAWGSANPAGDIDSSGAVDAEDLTALLAEWGGCEQCASGFGWILNEGGDPAGEVHAMEVFDDGTGAALYLGLAQVGSRCGVVKWDGSSWQGVSESLEGQAVKALATFDDGTGARLFSGGDFIKSTGGVLLNHIAKWDGIRWIALESGLDGGVNALAVFDDGTGPALYAGGVFTTAGGVPANHIAKWDGKQWSALGSGVNGPVAALAVYDDGHGSALYVGGGLSLAGGGGASNIAKWDGKHWSALGSGVSGGPVLTLATSDDGTGPALYAGGSFTAAGGVAASSVAKWDGKQWTALGSGVAAGDLQRLSIHWLLLRVGRGRVCMRVECSTQPAT